MADPTYPLFSVFAFCGFFFSLVPLPWHLQAWNAGTCIYMFWASLANLIQFVNSLVWKGRTANVAPVWCDIATKLIVGAGVGLPAASLCINRRLYNIASVRTVCVTHSDRKKAVYVDVAIAMGIPSLVMILHSVVQGHRFNILEDVGCIPTTYNTPPAYPLVLMWPLVLASISFVYAFFTLRAFWIRRAQFNEMLALNNSLSISRYFRLMLLSCLEMCCTTPAAAYSIYINTDGVRMAPWISWADTHYNFSYVEVIPRSVWRGREASTIAVEMGRWIYPCTALLFFLLFGFAQEARRNYRAAFRWMGAKLGLVKDTSRSIGALRHQGFVKDKKDCTFQSETTFPLGIYSPRECRRSDSLFSSVISFDDTDLEKCHPSTLSSCPSISSPSETVLGCSDPASPTSTSHINPFSPPSLSPPPIAYYPSPSPPFRRPFSSSTILPLTANFPSSAGPTLEPPNTLPIAIHRESCQTF